jgi:hypothetical protein
MEKETKIKIILEVIFTIIRTILFLKKNKTGDEKK